MQNINLLKAENFIILNIDNEILTMKLIGFSLKMFLRNKNLNLRKINFGSCLIASSDKIPNNSTLPFHRKYQNFNNYLPFSHKKKVSTL